MATIKSYTDIEQSKKLAEFLPLESADMCYVLIDTDKNKYSAEIGKYIGILPHYPCWSLAALRNLLPPAIKPNKDSYLFESHNTFDNSWVYRYYNEDDVSYLYCKNTNEVDVCYEMILKLHKMNLL
jgi:hypothetical protein